MLIRPPMGEELDQLGRLWHDGWHEAHAHLVPPELTRLRTLESFRRRLETALPAIRVAGDPLDPLGFCWIREDELFQLFVRPAARGGGAAAALLADGEARLAEQRVRTAWLACAIGNDRAARFYEKSGWQRAGLYTNNAETAAGPIPIEVWRYEKEVGG